MLVILFITNIIYRIRFKYLEMHLLCQWGIVLLKRHYYPYHVLKVGRVLDLKGSFFIASVGVVKSCSKKLRKSRISPSEKSTVASKFINTRKYTRSFRFFYGTCNIYLFFKTETRNLNSFRLFRSPAALLLEPHFKVYSSSRGLLGSAVD